MNKNFISVFLLMLAMGVSVMAQSYEEDLAFFKERVKTLGSDEFGGRKPLTEYETKTIHYIADEFKKLGLQPANGDSYFQPVKEISTFTRPVKDKITVKCAKGSMDLKFSDDIVVWTNRGTEQVVIPTTDYVFCGFGINAPEYGWNDYANVDVKGKIVIAMVNDPGFYDTSLFRGKNMTYYGRWTYKFEEAQRQGAAGLLVLHNEAAASYGWKVCQASHVQTNIALCSETMNAEALGMKGWLSEEACKKMFALSGLNFDETIAAAKKPGFKSFTMKAKSKVILNVKMTVGESHNVAAVLPGTVHSRRSIVFVAVTSEECGLLGSQYYCEHPLFPLSKTAINLNFDGTAPRERTHDISLRAAGKTDTDALVIAMASAQGRTVKVITAKPKVYRYHQPNDEYDESWWDFDGAMEDMNLMFSIGLVIANNDEMPKWTKEADFQRQ